MSLHIKQAALAACIFLLIRLPGFSQKLKVPGNLDQHLTSQWRLVNSEIENTGHTLWASLTMKNVGETSLESPIFYAKYFDAAGRECLSLLFVEQHAYGAQPERTVPPHETRIFESTTGSIFPIVPPVSLRIYTIVHLTSGEYLNSIDEKLSIPPTIMGGSIEGQGILEVPRQVDSESFLALASVQTDSYGTMLRSTILNVADSSLQEKIQTFIRSLRFLPGGTGKASGPELSIILFARQEALTSSARPRGWPWTLPWVQATVKQLPPTQAKLPVLTVLMFGTKDHALKPQGPTQLQYFALGSDWCPDLFQWTTDPTTKRRVRIWK